MASNNWSQSNHSRGHAQTGMGRDSVTNADATRSTMGETPNLSRRTGSGGYPEQSAQIISNGPGVGIVVPGQSIGIPARHPATLATAITHCSSNQHTIARLEAENAQLRSQYHQLIGVLMQKHPELGSPPAPNWRTVVTCREEDRVLESQLGDISRRGSAGLDVTADVLDRLSQDYGSLLTTYRGAIRERAVLEDDVKRLKRQSKTFTGSKKFPFLHCAEDTNAIAIVGLDDIIRASRDNGHASALQQHSQPAYPVTATPSSSGSAIKRPLNETHASNGIHEISSAEQHSSKRRKRDQA